MFKTEAAKTPSGNWQVKATCANGHTVFKDQFHPNDPYKCPYCGREVY